MIESTFVSASLIRRSEKWISRLHFFVPESALLLRCKGLFGLVAPEPHSRSPECFAPVHSGLAGGSFGRWRSAWCLGCHRQELSFRRRSAVMRTPSNRL